MKFIAKDDPRFLFSSHLHHIIPAIFNRFRMIHSLILYPSEQQEQRLEVAFFRVSEGRGCQETADQQIEDKVHRLQF